MIEGRIANFAIFLVKGRVANFGIFLDVLSFCVLDDFLSFSKKSGFAVFLVHPETTLPDGLETYD